ncbi:MAG: sensor histidine kinase [Pyrinomonadaceae bacterium]
MIADNGEGVWNEDGKSLRVVVLPPFYRTWWFLVLCALAAILIVRLFYGYRLAQLEKINEARTAFTQQLIEYQENERKRIAVELHDSIGQSLIVIRNRALMGLDTPDKHERLIAQMEEISDAAADSIKEVREIAHNLHPYQLEHLGLTTALETMIEAVENATEIQFDSQIDDLDDTLSKDAEINLYRIVQESLNNVVKHSGASKVDISLREGGPEPEKILPDAPEVAAWVSGFFAARAGLPEISDAPRVRLVQRQQMETALPWAVRALDLPPLPTKELTR